MLALAEKLPPVTPRQRKWAFDHCFRPLAVVWPRKCEVRCLCCGQTVAYDKDSIDRFHKNDEYGCPLCGHTTSVIAPADADTAVWYSKAWFTVLTTFRGHQLARTWEVCRINDRRQPFASYTCDEIYQIWITPEGREVITGRQLHRGLNSTTWDFHKPLGICRHNGSCTGAIAFDDIYDITGNYLYPKVRVTPLLRRNGWSNDMLKYHNMIPMTDVWQLLLANPTAEMLVKIGQHDLLLHMVRRGLKQLPFLHSVRIANRHGYIVPDASMWLDMLQMAQELGRDTHNPQIVCPDDLRKAHDSLLVPVTRLRQRLERERKAREALEWEARYAREKAPYLGITFGSDDIRFHVLQSVAEFAEEGKAMHHCVFTGSYYTRPESLILSARDEAGHRLETVEIDLRKMQIAQSRAVCNGNSPRHNEILQLVTDNMPLIRRAKASARKAKSQPEQTV